MTPERRRFVARSVLVFHLLALCATSVFGAVRAQTTRTSADATARSGKYAVTLRLPEGGIYAGEDVELEFRVVDLSADDLVLGPVGVIRAAVNVTIAMPSMPGMPAYNEVAHAESVPGDYGVHPTFPHGGNYSIRIRVTPPDADPFAVDFPLTVKDADPNRPRRPTPFFVEIEAKPKKPEVGRPVDLVLTVRERARPKEIVAAFDVTHEKLLHLMIVRDDLGVYAHEHPEQQPDGSFTLRYAFPTAGRYQLFADTAPRGRGSHVLMTTLDVKGPSPSRFSVFSAPISAPVVVEGVKASLAIGVGGLVAREQTVMTVDLTDAVSGAPVVDLQPYLGAMGHLVLVHEDGETYVHSHPDDTARGGGPNGSVSFVTRFARAGLYRAWAQFRRSGKILTADFVVRVNEAK